MKKNTIILIALLSFSSVAFVSCGEAEKKQEAPAEVATEHYQCPMKCTEEIKDTPGQGSVCGMELEKITKS